MEETDIVAKNGRIYTLAGVLIPPTIVPILPHRCDETRSQVATVRESRQTNSSLLLHIMHSSFLFTALTDIAHKKRGASGN